MKYIYIFLLLFLGGCSYNDKPTAMVGDCINFCEKHGGIFSFDSYNYLSSSCFCRDATHADLWTRK